MLERPQSLRLRRAQLHLWRSSGAERQRVLVARWTLGTLGTTSMILISQFPLKDTKKVIKDIKA